MCKRALIAVVCVLLVPVVVPAADSGPGGTGEGVQALQQCGGASSGAAVCAGEAAGAGQAEQATHRWWWVAPGAAVAVAASGIIALVVALKGAKITSWLTGGKRKRTAGGDLESDSLLRNGPAATYHNAHTGLEHHSDWDSRWDAVRVQGTHAACVEEIEGRIRAGLIGVMGEEAPFTGILVGCAMRRDLVSKRIVAHSNNTNGRKTCGGGCPVPRPPGSPSLLRGRTAAQTPHPSRPPPHPAPPLSQTATFLPPEERWRGGSSS